ncbi:MAG TPA: sn-glycerol-1-phosphate dehydrogenase [Nitrososphaeraceae archaeon]
MTSDTNHLMELPRKILIGNDVIYQLGTLIRDLNDNATIVIIISGNTVKARVGKECMEALDISSLKHKWIETPNASMKGINSSQLIIKKEQPDFIIGLGGGRSVDVAKMISFNLNIPFISVPTSASHDGISSPFVSIRGRDKPYSLKAHAPIGVIADTKLISEAPYRLQASGCGDLIGKMTAVKDWELARDNTNEYFGSYAANLANMSAKIIIENSNKLGDRAHIRTIVEALISAGVASCIAGSSRPCSGSEHLFSHALEYVSNGKCGLHGERVGIGTIIMSKIHGMEYDVIIKTLENIKAPTTAKEIDVTEKEIIKSLLIAQSLRPERYTILNKIKMDQDLARSIAKSVSVI